MDKKNSLILVLSTFFILYSSTLFANQAPVIDSLVAESQVILPGGVTTIVLSAHDPDCPDTCTSGCGLYIRASYTDWEASGGTISNINNGSNGSPYTSSITWTAPTSTGCYTINVSIWDNSGMMCEDPSLEATASISISVGAGSPPIISSILAEPDTIFLGKSSVITAAVSDPDGDPLTYSWSAAKGTISGANDGDPLIITWQAPTVGGTHNIVLTVNDGVGCEVSRSVGVQVVLATYLDTILEGLGKPARIATDQIGRIFVSYPSEGCVRVYNRYIEPVFTIHNIGKPVAVSVEEDGQRIYVGDEIYGRVVVYDTSGNFLFLLGSGDGQFERPQDIAVDPVTGAIYVTDAGDHQVKVFNHDGTYAFSFGGYGSEDGQLVFPTGIVIDKGEGLIFVSDFGNGRIQVFDLWGGWKATLGEDDEGEGELPRAQGLSLDDCGRVYVADAFQGSVQSLDRSGEHIAFVGSYGTEPGQLRTPLDAAVDVYGRLLVTSVNNSRVEVFALESYQGVPEREIPEIPVNTSNSSTGCGCRHISPSEDNISSEGIANFFVLLLPLFFLFLRRRVKSLHLGIVLLSILLLSIPARALDAPHDLTASSIVAGGMHCGSCHIPHFSLGSILLSDTAAEALCISCHNGTTATEATIHQGKTCTDCHDPHQHSQYRACLDVGDCDTTVFRDLGAGDTTSTSTDLTADTLTDTTRSWALDDWIGYNLVPNTITSSTKVFKIVDSGADWVQVRVDAALDLLDVATSGDTYAIFYGKLVTKKDPTTHIKGRLYGTDGAGGGVWRDIKFYDNNGPFSFSDNTDPWNDEVCNTCHSAGTTSYHHYDGGAPTQSHYDGDNCTSACHLHNNNFAGEGDCIGCHRSAGSVRKITGSGGDFDRLSHHVTSGPTTNEVVTKYDCVVCHSEGTTDASMTSYHGDSYVDLKNADTGANIRLSISPPYNGSTLTNFCLTCHDSNGATFTYVPALYGGAGNGLQPFTDLNTVLNVYDQFRTTNFSSHAISAIGAMYTCGGSGIPTGSFVSPWEDCSTTECSDCHHVDTNAHGTVNNRWLLESSSGNDETVDNTNLICVKCHTYSVYTLNDVSGSVFCDHDKAAHQTGTDNSFGIWCLSCHGGGNDRAGSIHGTNQQTTDDSGLGSYDEYRFLNGAGLDYWYNPGCDTNNCATCSTMAEKIGNNLNCTNHDRDKSWKPNFIR
ncbi:MAG: hypothetical protein JSU92_09000 [Deltaproteobacteria bacterium]|nr:MAG: hypothetical protein JSU92_09000 [Deltaproteobacteria bacterium]